MRRERKTTGGQLWLVTGKGLRPNAITEDEDTHPSSEKTRQFRLETNLANTKR